MPNDIAKLRRLMRRANYIRTQQLTCVSKETALKQAWWYETFRNALANGFARFTYTKADGSTRTALGTRSPSLIPVDKAPKSSLSSLDVKPESAATIPYFDLEKKEWRSFNILHFVSLDQSWLFNSPVTLNIDHIND